MVRPAICVATTPEILTLALRASVSVFPATTATAALWVKFALLVPGALLESALILLVMPITVVRLGISALLVRSAPTRTASEGQTF